MNDVSRELGSALGIAILGSLFNSGYREAVSDATASLPPEAAHAVTESAGAAFAVASELGARGRQLADATRDAFAAGLGDALVAGAAIAILTAAFTLWRAPRRDSSGLTEHVDAGEIALGSAATVSPRTPIAARV